MIGVVGISPFRIGESFGAEALALSGRNFGNLLFTKSVYRQTVDEVRHLGFDFLQKLDGIDQIIIPAANWISPEFDFTFLADQLEKTNLPILMVGLGTQVRSLEDLGGIPSSSVRLLKIIEERSSAISVRGKFTADVLEKLGIKKLRLRVVLLFFIITEFLISIRVSSIVVIT
jgi:hypothetical protein